MQNVKEIVKVELPRLITGALGLGKLEYIFELRNSAISLLPTHAKKPRAFSSLKQKFNFSL